MKEGIEIAGRLWKDHNQRCTLDRVGLWASQRLTDAYDQARFSPMRSPLVTRKPQCGGKGSY